ncbi:MAG: 50S ribosomal protein L9 [Anaerolineaceae bacterium 4572_5.2]|nr:MAG: 50S ribosomal protein L9 [Anaerolineaceae bacterium 4572_5.2]
MKVLLLQDVDNLGLAGDVVKVANGYGRNYLLPQEMAALATSGALKQAQSIRNAGELTRAQEKSDAEAIANQLKGAVLAFERRAGVQDKLYGSVTANDIVQALNDKFGLEIDKRKVSLPEPIRTLGQWDVIIKLMIEVSASVKVVVIQEGESQDAALAASVEAEAVEVVEAAAEVETE